MEERRKREMRTPCGVGRTWRVTDGKGFESGGSETHESGRRTAPCGSATCRDRRICTMIHGF